MGQGGLRILPEKFDMNTEAMMLFGKFVLITGAKFKALEETLENMSPDVYAAYEKRYTELSSDNLDIKELDELIEKYREMKNKAEE